MTAAASSPRGSKPIRTRRAQMSEPAVRPSAQVANSSANQPALNPSTPMNTKGDPDTNENRQPKLNAPIREWPIAERWVSALP